MDEGNIMAFPTFCGEGANYQEGMNLLDYFAGQALASGLFSRVGANLDFAGEARDCYDVAEAMLAERARRAGGRGK